MTTDRGADVLLVTIGELRAELREFHEHCTPTEEVSAEANDREGIVEMPQQKQLTIAEYRQPGTHVEENLT